MRFYYVVFIDNERIANIVEGIRLFADLNQKHRAHITVRGPYETTNYGHSTNEKLNEWNHEIKGLVINVKGTDIFYNENQNTVFFKCDGDKKSELKKIWRKFNFSGYNPHITIYDGDDAEWSNKILDVLNKYPLDFYFKPTRLEKLFTIDKSEIDFPYFLKDLVNYNLVSNLLNENVSLDIIKGYSQYEKLERIEKLIRLL